VHALDLALMALEKRDSGPEYVALRLEELLKPKGGEGNP